MSPLRAALTTTARGRSLLLAVGAFLLYGSWAFVANVSHGAGDALQAFVTQGVLSFVSTLTITIIMEWAFRRGTRPAGRFAASVVAGCLPMYVLTIGLHAALGTPELLRTVAPVLALGTAYCVIYSVGLLRISRNHRAVTDDDAHAAPHEPS